MQNVSSYCSLCSKILCLLVPAYPGSPGKRTLKRVCVCVCVCDNSNVLGLFGSPMLLIFEKNQFGI